jgi:type III secretory pathway component EscS
MSIDKQLDWEIENYVERKKSLLIILKLIAWLLIIVSGIFGLVQFILPEYEHIYSSQDNHMIALGMIFIMIGITGGFIMLAICSIADTNIRKFDFMQRKGRAK